MKIYDSKKATFTGIGAVLIPTVITFATMILSQQNVDPAVIESVTETLAWALGILLAGYNVGQGIADHGKSAAEAKNVGEAAARASYTND